MQAGREESGVFQRTAHSGLAWSGIGERQSSAQLGSVCSHQSKAYLHCVISPAGGHISKDASQPALTIIPSACSIHKVRLARWVTDILTKCFHSRSFFTRGAELTNFFLLLLLFLLLSPEQGIVGSCLPRSQTAHSIPSPLSTLKDDCSSRQI